MNYNPEKTSLVFVFEKESKDLSTEKHQTVDDTHLLLVDSLKTFHPRLIYYLGKENSNGLDFFQKKVFDKRINIFFLNDLNFQVVLFFF